MGWHSNPQLDVMNSLNSFKDKPRTTQPDALRVSITRSIPVEDKSLIDTWLDNLGIARTL